MPSTNTNPDRGMTNRINLLNEDPANEAAEQVKPEHRQAAAARLAQMGHDLIALADSQLANDCPQSPFAADSMINLMEHLVECYGQARSGDEFDVLVEEA